MVFRLKLHNTLRITVLGATLALFGAQQAAALSCMRPNLARSFNFYEQSDDKFVIAVGKLTPTDKIPDYKQGVSREVAAEFKGGFLGRWGVKDQPPQTVMIKTSCLASWCGAIPERSVDVLAFIKKTPAGLVLETGPCHGEYTENPSKKLIRTLQTCLAKSECSKAEINKIDRR